MIDKYFHEYKPIEAFFFPPGWLSVKNNMYDVPVEILRNSSPDTLFKLRKCFFYEDVFISQHCSKNWVGKDIKATVDICCRESDEDDISYDYTVEFCIFLKRDNIFSDEKVFYDRKAAAHQASVYMCFYNYCLLEDKISIDKMSEDGIINRLNNYK